MTTVPEWVHASAEELRNLEPFPDEPMPKFLADDDVDILGPVYMTASGKVPLRVAMQVAFTNGTVVTQDEPTFRFTDGGRVFSVPIRGRVVAKDGELVFKAINPDWGTITLRKLTPQDKDDFTQDPKAPNPITVEQLARFIRTGKYEVA